MRFLAQRDKRCQICLKWQVLPLVLWNCPFPSRTTYSVIPRLCTVLIFCFHISCFVHSIPLSFQNSVYNFNHSLDILGTALINGIFQYVKAWELGPILMPQSKKDKLTRNCKQNTFFEMNEWRGRAFLLLDYYSSSYRSNFVT